MSNTPVTFGDRIRVLFAKNKEDFWFKHFTSEELALKRMDVWQLAKAINDARVRNLAGEAEKLIVADHMLKERLAKIQALPVYISLFTAFIGVIVGAWLTAAFQKPQEQSKCICEYQSANTAKNTEPKVKDALVPAAPSQPVLGIQQDIKTSADVKNDGKPAEKNKP